MLKFKYHPLESGLNSKQDTFGEATAIKIERSSSNGSENDPVMEIKSPMNAEEFKIQGEQSYARLPIIQEIKVVCLHFGAIVLDVLQENHETHKRFIQMLKFPY